MAIALFGTKSFEVKKNKIYTFKGFEYGTSLQTEKQESAGKKPSTYNKGPNLNTLKINISLNATLGVNPRVEIEDWEAIKDAAIAYPFFLGNRPLGKNKWLLKEVGVIGTVIGNSGNIIAAEINLQFDEYVKSGIKTASSSTSAKSSPAINLDDVIEPNTLTTAEKAGLKRNNPYFH